jgi:hypothetical protein
VSNFQDSIQESINTDQAFKGEDPAGGGGLIKRLQSWNITNIQSSGQPVAEIIAFLGIKVLLPLAVLVGIVFAFIGFYKVMTSSSEDESKKGTQFLIRWTVGVITMVSAWFIANKLVWVGANQYGTDQSSIFGKFASITQAQAVWWQAIAAEVYNQLLFPVIKLLMLVIIGILFIVLFINLFKYLFSPAEDITKKALTIIIRNVIGILTIILAKYIVEAIFGQYDTVANVNRFNTNQYEIGWVWNQGGKNLWAIGTPIWDLVVDMDKFFTILNWILWILTLIILLLIIYQWYKLLVNPSDSGGLAEVGKTLLYIFLWILVLWFGYLIANAIIPIP